MKLEDISTDRGFLFEHVPCERLEPGEISVTEGRLEMQGVNVYCFKNRENTFTLRITDSAQQKGIQDCLRRQLVGLASLESSGSLATLADGRKKFCLRIMFFLRSVRFGRFQVILSNKAKNTLKKHGYEMSDYNCLADLFQFTDGVSGEHCFAFQSVDSLLEKPKENNGEDKEAATKVASHEALQTEKETPPELATDATVAAEDDSSVIDETIATLEETDENTDGDLASSIDGKSLKLCGQGITLFVTIEGDGVESRAMAYRAVVSKSRPANATLYWQLAYGELAFSDEQSYVAARVRDILHATPNYISIWNEYAIREGDFLLRRARAVGEISYSSNFNITPEGIELTVTDESTSHLENLATGDCLAAYLTPPPYIEDQNMNWQSYQDWKAQQLQLLKVKRLPRVPVFEVKAKSKYSVTLANERELPVGSKLYFSINGDEKQIERREKARYRIENGTSASPTLGLILGSQNGAFSTSQDVAAIGLTTKKISYIEPLSQILRQKIFRNPPTSAQIKAIDIALNTPDIAIIQGPPGTGKTTVITAILERLNELSEKRQMQPGQVLVTSLQHDAVHNIIERVNVNSLPTIKFGQRRTDDNLSMQEELSRWCNRTLTELEQKHPQLKQSADEKKLFSLYNAYFQSPSDTKAVNFLTAAKELVRDDLLLEEIERILEEIAPLKSTGNDELLRKIYQLRTKESSFADDGQIAAMDLYNELETLYGEALTEKQAARLDLLKKAAMADIPDKVLLDELVRIRHQLLAECIGSPPFESDEAREDIAVLYGKLKKKLQRPGDELGNIVYDLYSELRDNPYSVYQAIASYSFVFAATAQQTEKAEIKRAKGVENPQDDDTHAQYETVVVDEAARVNPGDLMIPLSQASRRIILVGDQRQLPHMYDEEIFQSLREEGLLEDEGDIKTSMFEHLWEKALELSKSDGIDRRVTLDAQYRMHPLLGKFVSDNFYKPYGEPFSSPLPAEKFAQGICSSPIRWVNIPNSYGQHERTNNFSLKRKCEVDYIVDTLAAYLADPQNNELTFGVISFYRSQVQAIKQAIKQRLPENLAKRVRIGTVDEFQGMEFDVMFLSIVRSKRFFPNMQVKVGDRHKEINLDELERIPADADVEDKKSHKDYVQAVGSSIYGFLTDNRLCVALSRQKRLLIVVGDADMFGGEISQRIAKVCVPAMYNLFRLCLQENSLVNS